MRHTNDGTRLLVVCDVALGKCHDVRKKDLTLTRAPDGYHSVHGVRSAPSAESDFEVSGREEGLPLKWGGGGTSPVCILLLFICVCFFFHALGR